MSLLDTEQLHWLQNELLDRKRSIEQRLEHNDHYGLEHTHRYETGELSTIDNHPGDVGTEVYERAKDVSLTEHDEFMLERIDSALQAMKEGSYGSCAECGAAIPYERLQAIPYTIYCVQHSREAQASNNRPVEEEFLSPPFGRSSLDEHEYSGFDGEDAWQIVESWGSSNSPPWPSPTRLPVMMTLRSKQAMTLVASLKAMRTSSLPIYMVMMSR